MRTLLTMLAYLSMRGNASGLLFLLKNGQPPSRPLLTNWLRQILSMAGIEGNFSSHSFQIGAATVAAHNGVPDHVVQALERWTSNAYQLSVRTHSESLTGLSSSLASLAHLSRRSAPCIGSWVERFTERVHWLTYQPFYTAQGLSFSLRSLVHSIAGLGNSWEYLWLLESVSSRPL